MLSSPKRTSPVIIVPAAAGLQQLLTIGTWSMITGFVIFALAIPTICMLPYVTYMTQHCCNIAVPLYLLVMGYTFRGAVLNLCKPDYSSLCCLTIRPPFLTAAIYGVLSLFGILVSWGGFFPKENDGSNTMGMVLQQVRTDSWGDLNPTENQIWTLHILYTLISFLYGIGGLLAFFGMVIAVIYWITLAHLPRLEKGKQDNEESDVMSTEFDTENGECGKRDKDKLADKVVTIGDGQSGQYV